MAGVGENVNHPTAEAGGLRSASFDSPGCRVGLCLEPHDLAASKLYAGRPKDIDFVRSLLDHGLVDSGILQDRLRMLNGDATKAVAGSQQTGRLYGVKGAGTRRGGFARAFTAA